MTKSGKPDLVRERVAGCVRARNYWVMREGAKRDLARRLRAEMTPHERKLWYLLRDRRLGTEKFRRQLPVGPYVVDFASVGRRLIIEMDGSQHATSKSDPRRDAYLQREGWRILRFWNNELTENREGVLLKILEALEAK